MARSSSQTGPFSPWPLTPSVPRCFWDHPITAALIIPLIGWSAASLLISGSWLAPRFSNQGSLLFFVRQSRLIQSFDVDSAKAPPDVWLKRLGSSAAAQRWQSSDGQRWWMVWLRTVRPCWCFLRQKLVSHGEFHRRFLMLNFCSQMNFIEKAFSPHSLPGLPRLQALKTNALTG